MRGQQLSIEQYVQGLQQGDKVVLGRAITLAESQREEDQLMTSRLLQAVLPLTGRSIRIGISGVPGVGKSTFIEAFGKYLTSYQRKMAVLAVDPTSARTKGSILGDKTRMEELAKDPLAFIRPSASGNQLGGVAGKTREAILLCEAAGYEIILIETVGVGQSETAVRNMTDFFLLLMLAGAGDELQGIKKGIIEMADLIVINKADGDNLSRVQQAQADLRNALHFFPAAQWNWTVPVLTCSALERKGISEVWQTVAQYQQAAMASGFFDENRKKQSTLWMREDFELRIRQMVDRSETLKQMRARLEDTVYQQLQYPPEAARQLLETWLKDIRRHE